MVKLKGNYTLEHMKRMARRAVANDNEGIPELLKFVNKMEENDFVDSKCRREFHELEEIMKKKTVQRIAGHKPTLNYHLIRLTKKYRN